MSETVTGHWVDPGDEYKGKWMNKFNNKVIIVEDMIMDGENMLVRSTSGILDGNTFTNNYVKISDETFNESNLSVDTNPNQLELPMPTNKYSLDDIIISNEKAQETSFKMPKSNQINNEELIHKVFSKRSPDLKLTFNINLEELPIDDLKILNEILDVSIDDISNYIIKYYLNTSDILNDINEYINKKLEKNK